MPDSMDIKPIIVKHDDRAEVVYDIDDVLHKLVEERDALREHVSDETSEVIRLKIWGTDEKDVL